MVRHIYLSDEQLKNLAENGSITAENGEILNLDDPDVVYLTPDNVNELLWIVSETSIEAIMWWDVDYVVAQYTAGRKIRFKTIEHYTASTYWDLISCSSDGIDQKITLASSENSLIVIKRNISTNSISIERPDLYSIYRHTYLINVPIGSETFIIRFDRFSKTNIEIPFTDLVSMHEVTQYPANGYYKKDSLSQNIPIYEIVLGREELVVHCCDGSTITKTLDTVSSWTTILTQIREIQ